ncbi:MAG: Spermine synthase [Microgenomates group bacterium GW2011_GWA2_44_7]|nr:MAG: Spermine synthase [Microgenomates group bacterium GW2011_GWA2_44_7]KKT78242.1 MAG: Spermine synthase [Microgenomates group bacterium GW2011_GWB1_44_8]
MNLLNYFKTQELERVKSKFNGEIVVVKSEGEFRFLVGGLTQSGRFIDKIWQKAIAYLKKHEFFPKSCLILGLGGGTVARIISMTWPGIKVTGVEIDPQMIDLGKKYLALAQTKSLTLKIQDAQKFVQDSQNKYDLIIIDTYIGEQAVKNLRDMSKLERLLSPGGSVVFNFLFHTRKLKQEAEEFIESLEQKDVVLLRELTNLLVIVRTMT